MPRYVPRNDTLPHERSGVLGVNSRTAASERSCALESSSCALSAPSRARNMSLLGIPRVALGAEKGYRAIVSHQRHPLMLVDYLNRDSGLSRAKRCLTSRQKRLRIL